MRGAENFFDQDVQVYIAWKKNFLATKQTPNILTLTPLRGLAGFFESKLAAFLHTRVAL